MRPGHEAAALFDQVPDPVACCAREGTVLYLNPPMCRLLGRSRPEDLSGQTLWAVLPLSHEEAFSQAFRRVAKTGTAEHFEHAFAPGDRWHELHVYLAAEQVWVVGRDVTMQKKTLELEARAHARALAIGDALPALVSLIDSDLRYQFVNATYTAWFGREASEIVGRPVPEVLGAEAFRAVEGSMRRALAGETVSYETRLNYVSGPRDVQGTYTPYRVDGRIEGLVVLVVDVTERVRQSAELRAATEARDEFLTIASHELRTPLATLELQLEALKRPLEREAALRKLEVAASQTARLTTLVDELLSVSRAGADQFRLVPTDFELTELLHEVTALFEAAASSAQTRLFVTGLSPTTVRWDRDLFAQAVKNLLSNALKYGRGKPVELRLSLEGERVLVSVRDEGIGVSSEARARIFERFERAVSSSNYGGLGLGLYLARRIAVAHGGAIALESTPGRGATFTLDLPRTAPG